MKRAHPYFYEIPFSSSSHATPGWYYFLNANQVGPFPTREAAKRDASKPWMLSAMEAAGIILLAIPLMAGHAAAAGLRWIVGRR